MTWRRYLPSPIRDRIEATWVIRVSQTGSELPSRRSR